MKNCTKFCIPLALTLGGIYYLSPGHAASYINPSHLPEHTVCEAVGDPISFTCTTPDRDVYSCSFVSCVQIGVPVPACVFPNPDGTCPVPILL